MAKSAKKINEKQIREENEMVKLLKIVVILTIIFGAFYLLTTIITKEEEKLKENTNTQETIQYNQILTGNIFSKNGNYYVLVESKDDKNVQVYEAYLSTYSTIKDAKKVYISKLDDILNLKYVGETTNLTTELSELKFANTVLLEIKDGKIVKSYTNDEEIRNVVKEISGTTEEK